MTNVNGDSQVASAGKDRTIKLYSLVFHEKEFKNGSLDKLQLSLSIAGKIKFIFPIERRSFD